MRLLCLVFLRHRSVEIIPQSENMPEECTRGLGEEGRDPVPPSPTARAATQTSRRWGAGAHRAGCLRAGALSGGSPWSWVEPQWRGACQHRGNCPQRLVSASPGPARAGENHRLPARALLRCRPSDCTYCRECPPPRSSPGGMTTDVFGLKSFSLLPLSLRR